jgi:hypothetical protein
MRRNRARAVSQFRPDHLHRYRHTPAIVEHGGHHVGVLADTAGQPAFDADVVVAGLDAVHLPATVVDRDSEPFQ